MTYRQFAQRLSYKISSRWIDPDFKFQYFSMKISETEITVKYEVDTSNCG